MVLGSKAKMTIVAGLAGAALFFALGVMEIFKSNSAQEVAKQNVVTQPQQIVLAAALRPIEVGQTITADMVRNAPADPSRFPQVATPAEVIGKVATKPIPAGSLIPREAIDGESKLAIRVPVGMRAMSIDTTAEIAVAGLLRPGDKVDVQVVYPGADALTAARLSGKSRAQTLLQGLQVLAVGEVVVGTTNTAQAVQGIANSPSPPARTVTLALTPDQVSILSLAKSTGAIYLSLRNPTDQAEVASQTLLSNGPVPEPVQIAAPTALSAPRKTPETQPRRPKQVTARPIEVTIGNRREIIYSGSE